MKDYICKVVIVNGYPRAGKDTFVEFIKELVEPEVIEHSTIAFSKYIAELMGWNGIKSIYSRSMLSELKEFSNKWFDKSFVDMTTLIECHHKKDCIVIFHIREPKEIERVSQWCKRRQIDIITVFINGIMVEKEQLNESDLNVENYVYDCYINNKGTLDNFKNNILNDFIITCISKTNTGD